MRATAELGSQQTIIMPWCDAASGFGGSTSRKPRALPDACHKRQGPDSMFDVTPEPSRT